MTQIKGTRGRPAKHDRHSRFCVQIRYGDKIQLEAWEPTREEAEDRAEMFRTMHTLSTVEVLTAAEWENRRASELT